MKARKYIFILGCFSILAVIFACSKSFLSKQPLGALSASSLANTAGVNGLLIGAYHMVTGEGGAAGLNWGNAPSNWVFGSVNADDSYKGSTPSDQGDIVPLETWAYNTNNPYLEQKWQAVYDGAQRCNDVLRVLPLATDIDAATGKIITAEARVLRGHFHFEAKKIWNNVPWVDETITTTNPNAANVDAGGTYIDIWPKIEADFQFGIDNLPDVQPQAGRVNKWAAMAFLAKAYMYEAKYTQAKALLDQLIANGKTANGKKYALVHYEDNFNGATDNSAESVFACQNSVNDGSGTNGNYGDNLNFPNGSGPGGCCGFNNPSISLANSYKTDASGFPLPDTYNTGKVVGDSSNIYTGNLDPRIDWVMGRPGIPYFDWGIVPTNAWIRDPGTDGFFSPKKNVYAKSQAGAISSTETSFWGPTQMDANNTNIIRFADIILWDAECEAQVGSLAQALIYVNMIRTRAADPTGWVYKGATYTAGTGLYAPQTTPADNYKIATYAAGFFTDKPTALKYIFFERKLELAMEGHRFFDLRRQDAGTGSMATTLNAYVAVEKTRNTIFSVNPLSTFTKGKNEWYPIPQAEIDVENSTGKVFLKQNPGY